MWILGMTAVPLGGKLFVALLMLLLAGLLIRTIRGVPFIGRSIGHAVVAVAAGVVTLGAFPSVFDGAFHKLGILAAIVGALSAAFILQPVGRESTRRRSTNPVHLAALAFISGPILGLVLASLRVLLSDVSPLDRAHTFGLFTVVGTLAGFTGAVVVAVASASVSEDSSKSDEQD